MSFDGFPFIVGWELTLACNLSCSHCGSSAGHTRQNELTTEEALKICDQFAALLVREVDFTGGEALLRPDWSVIASYLVDKGIAVNLLTNGFNLRAKTVAKIKEAGISAVGISLDGLAATHDKIRGEGSFKSVLSSIQMFQEAAVPMNVITTVNALNLEELPSVYETLLSANVGQWRLQPIIPMGRVKDHPELGLDSKGILKLGNFIKDQSLKRGDGMQIVCSDGLEYVEVAESHADDRPWLGCSAGIAACGITSDGKVKGCLSVPDELVEGDLRQRDLWEIWFDPKAFAYTRNFSTDQLGDNCRFCDKGNECKGGCTSNSYSGTGCFHNDPFCYYKPSMESKKSAAQVIV